jgi:nickel/cobalt exporter
LPQPTSSARAENNGDFPHVSHTSGIVLFGILASLGSGVLESQRIESYLALGVGILVIALGLRSLIC